MQDSETQHKTAATKLTAAMEEVTVLIVGAGPAGLATAASLAALSIPSLILERDDCIGSLWRKRSYDRLHLHVAKKFSHLPHFPHLPTTPTFIPKEDFVQYLDDYAAKFNLRTMLRREVVIASFDKELTQWRIIAKNLATGEEEEYAAKYLVIASGENDVPALPEIPGMETFNGKVIHSSKYRAGEEYKGKDVLVVGCGNSGMEIAFDLWNFGARTSIVVRSQLHLVTKEIWLLGMHLMAVFPLSLVDTLILLLCRLRFGDTSKYGISRPTKGPFYLKQYTPVYPIIDVGTFDKIKSGEIQVLPSLRSIKDNSVTFADGKSHHFDAIILATGYKRLVKNWLKDDDYLISDDGMCKQRFPDHWKGRNGLYCAGLVWRGIYGITEDALSIANDIHDALSNESMKQVKIKVI